MIIEHQGISILHGSYQKTRIPLQIRWIISTDKLGIEWPIASQQKLLVFRKPSYLICSNQLYKIFTLFVPLSQSAT